MSDRIAALQTLLTRLIDSRDGYRTSINHVASAPVRDVLEEFLARRDRDAEELRGYLARNGHVIEDGGSALAAVHRGFVGLKDTVSGSDDAGTLAEIVRGEKLLLESYEAAIAAETGADPEYGFLLEQHQSLKAAIAHLQARHDLAA